MKRLKIVLAVGLLAVLGAPLVRAADDTPPNTLTDAEKKAGWVLLFDGKTTDGWRNYKKTDLSPGWKVIDGALTRAAGGAGDIVTDKEYDSFELTLDYKISKGGNSGLMYHVGEEEPAPWMTGPEIQIQDNKDGHDPQKSGWLYQFYSSEKDATRPAGEWNTLRILISPQKCEQYMNGVKYCDYVIGSEDWNERLAKSKFAKMPKFGKLPTGVICLQDHGNEVAFRNIKLRKVPAEGEKQTLEERFKNRVTVAFRRTPLHEAVREIGKQAGVTIELDGEALKREGYTKNMAQNLAVENTSANVALDELIKSYEKLQVVVDAKGDRIVVTTKEAAEALR